MATEFPGAIPIDSGDRTAQNQRDWLEDVRLELTALRRVVSSLSGWNDGVVAGGDNLLNSLKVQATTAPSMSVEVLAGEAIISKAAYSLAALDTSGAMTPPSGNPRIDVVQANLLTQDLTILTGVEAGSPVAPTISADSIKLAEITHQVGETVIKDTDDATGNGYIDDARTVINI